MGMKELAAAKRSAAAPRPSQPSPIPYLEMPEFRLEEEKEWTQYLKENGVVVLKGLIPEKDVEMAKSLYWDWLEGLNSGIDRKDPSTWVNKNWPGVLSLGFTTTDGGGHTKASWFLRSHERVTKAFETIWSATCMLTSFDTFITWRPWFLDQKTRQTNESWAPKVENLHIDQNPFHKQGLHAVQGMIPLFPVNRDIGGLQVIPKSHIDGENSDQATVRRLYPEHEHHDSDWIEFKKKDYHLFQKGQLVQADPGDIILWDSRTIHGGHVGSSPYLHDSQKIDLTRLSFTVCQTPYSSMEEGKHHKIIRSRQQAFEAEACTSHWPHAPVEHQMGRDRFPNRQRSEIEVTPKIHQLIGNEDLINEGRRRQAGH